jgi:hypothetical protein
VPKWSTETPGEARLIAAPAQAGCTAMMTIYPLFADQAFEPETLNSMSQAYEAVCEALGAQCQKKAMITDAVAERIIEFAQRGVRDTESLTAMTLQAFNAKR